MSNRKPEFDLAIVYGESHLIAASLPSLLFPVFGFIGACIQVRYKGDYTTCLAANNRTLEDDQLLRSTGVVGTEVAGV